MRRSTVPWPDAARYVGFVLRRWSEDRCPQMAGGLAYTTLLALVPLFAVVVAVLSSAAVFGPVMEEVKGFLVANLAPRVADKVVSEYLEDFAANAQRLGFAGSVGVFVVSIMLMLMIDRSLNAIWHVRRARPYRLLVPVYAVLLIAGPLALGVSVSVASYLAARSSAVLGAMVGWETVLLRVIPFVLSALAFFLLYKLVPHRYVPWTHAASGAAVAAVLFEAAKDGFGSYVRLVPAYGVVYGSFATLPLFLVWLYASWLIVLFGAELAACAGYWHHGLWKRISTAGTHFHEALQLARRLIACGPAGLTFKRMRAVTRLPVHELEDMVGRLQEAGIVQRVDRRRYVLSADPTAITLEQLYEATVAPVGGMRPEEWAEISGDFAAAARDMRQALRRPIVSLARKDPKRERAKVPRGTA